MNKKLLILLALVLVVIPAVAACGRTTTVDPTSAVAAKVPHPVDVRFENCNACHAVDQLNAKTPKDHVALGYTNQNCKTIACHRLAS